MKPFAFVFPGQGSQSVGMLDGWGNHPIISQAVAEASEALGEDLGLLIKDGPKEALALTTNTQPVMLVAAVASYRAWIAATGMLPSVVAGHSLGEYSALVASGVMTLAQATPLVRIRAQAMQDAVPVGVGAMAAILGMNSEQVISACAEITAELRVSGAGATEVVEAVNFNDPAQTVIAGSRLAVDKACERLKASGARRALPLPVSAPFHSSLMRPAAERLRERLAAVELAPPRIPVINNIDVAMCESAQDIRDALFRQAFGPVRWVECVRAIKARGVTTFVECGPGKVLTGLVKRIDPELTGLALTDLAALELIQTQLAMESSLS